jgi:hypothetical protein
MIGYLAKIFSQRSPLETLSESTLYRAVIMDTILKSSYNSRLFIYNPCEITDLAQPLIAGLIIEDKMFLPYEAPIPRVNGNWLHQLQKKLDEGIGYQTFNQWRKKNNIEIYSDFNFSRITYSKIRSFHAIEKFHPGLHPYTEALTHPEQQLKTFMTRYSKIFLKPDRGKQGKDIIVLNKKAEHWVAKHYTHTKITTLDHLDTDNIVEKLTPFLNQHPYVIQEGIHTMRYQQRPFVIRVIMVNNGKAWIFLSYVLFGSKEGDLSYTPQDWDDAQTKIAFEKLFSDDQAQQMQAQIKKISNELTVSLTQGFEGKVIELAYDFMLSTTQKIYLAEINTKPSTWDKNQFKDIFNIQDNETFIYLHQLVPHVRACTEFLVSKDHARNNFRVLTNF